VQLAEGHIGAVAAWNIGLRHRGQAAGLVAVSQQELARLDRCLARVVADDAGALDSRLADAVFESELLAAVCGHVHVQVPDRLDAPQVTDGIIGEGHESLHQGGVPRQRGHHQVHVLRSQRGLPLLRRAVPYVPYLGRPGGHAVAELRREAGQRPTRHAEGGQPGEAEGHGERYRPGRIEPW
jgi:hypothetical protein